MLIVDGLCKSFYRHPVLDNVSFHIRPGETVALMGKNGAGKSTLLRILARISAGDRGRISFNDRNLLKGQPAVRRDLLYLGHAPGLYPTLTTGENLTLALRLRGQAVQENRLREVITGVGLNPHSQRPIKVFSQGMLQRLKLALARLVDWSLLLFDEPLAGLDLEGQSLVENSLRDWKQSAKTMLLVFHDLDKARSICDRFLVLHNSRLALDQEAGGVPEAELKETLLSLVS